MQLSDRSPYHNLFTFCSIYSIWTAWTERLRGRGSRGAADQSHHLRGPLSCVRRATARQPVADSAARHPTSSAPQSILVRNQFIQEKIITFLAKQRERESCSRRATRSRLRIEFLPIRNRAWFSVIGHFFLNKIASHRFASPPTPLVLQILLEDPM